MMGITVDFDFSEIMTTAQKAAAKNGALDPDQVMMQYICTTEDGGHDPEGIPDEHVRPEHEALHGTTWRLDDPMAPVPPLDYGCRCAMLHVGGEGSFAARVLGSESRVEPITRGEAYARWLDSKVPGWDDIADAIKDVAQSERMSAAYVMLQERGIGQARSISRMIVDTLPPESAAKK